MSVLDVVGVAVGGVAVGGVAVGGVAVGGSRWEASRWEASRWEASRWEASRWEASRWEASRWEASRWEATHTFLPFRRNKVSSIATTTSSVADTSSATTGQATARPTSSAFQRARAKRECARSRVQARDNPAPVGWEGPVLGPTWEMVKWGESRLVTMQ